MSSSTILGKRKIAPDITGRDDVGGGVTEARVQDMIDEAVISAGAVTEAQVGDIFDQKITDKNILTSNQVETKITSKGYLDTTGTNNAIAAYVTTNNIPTQAQLNTKVSKTDSEIVGGDKTFTKPITITASSNHLVLGSTNPVTISTLSMPAPRIVSVPDPGKAATFLLSAGSRTIEGTTVFVNGYTSEDNVTINPGKVIYLGDQKNYIGGRTASSAWATPISGQVDAFDQDKLIGSTSSSNSGAIVRINCPNISGGKSTFTINDTPVNNGSFTSGSNTLNVNGNVYVRDELNLGKTSNQLVMGTGNTVTLSAPTPTTSRTYTLPDIGGNPSFVMTGGNQTITGEKTFNSSILTNALLYANLGINTSNVITDEITANGPLFANGANLFAGNTTFTGSLTATADSAVNKLRINNNSTATVGGSLSFDADKLKYRNSAGWKTVMTTEDVPAISELRRTRGKEYINSTLATTHVKRVVSFLARITGAGVVENAYYQDGTSYSPPMGYLWNGVNAVDMPSTGSDPFYLRVTTSPVYTTGSTTPMVRFQQWLDLPNDGPIEGTDGAIGTAGTGGIRECTYAVYKFDDSLSTNPNRYINLAAYTNTHRIVSRSDHSFMGGWGALYVEIEWWEPPQ